MPVTPEELARLSDDVTRIRSIAANLYCEKCAYSLRTLPTLGRCPECGHHYNARQDRMEGIFGMQDCRLPITRCFTALLGWGVVAFGVVIGVQARGMWGYVLAAIFAPMAMVASHFTFKGVTQYLSHRATARAVRQAREDRA